jgi:phage terminase large subunit
MQLVINDTYRPLLDDQSRYLVLKGGSSSGKSYFITQKIILRCLCCDEGLQGFLCLRTSNPTARRSIWQEFLKRLIELDIYSKVHIHETDMKLTFPNGNFIICSGLDDPQKIKSIVGITSCWLEEAIEFTFREFLEVNRRMRAVHGTYKQTILSYNPDDYYHWTKEIFWDPTTPKTKRYQKNATVLTTTIDDNLFATDEDRAELDAYKDIDESEYMIYRFGDYAMLRNLIYKNYEVTSEDKFPESFDEVIYGLDFGYENPSALLMIGIKDTQLYEKELLYEKHLTNSQLIERMKELITNKSDSIYADSAEPDRIKEIFNAGFNINEAKKDVQDGIDCVLRYKPKIASSSENHLREKRTYKRKEDKEGNSLEEPLPNFHLMDCERYALYTHMGQEQPRIYLV